jgi:hypothetical protein
MPNRKGRDGDPRLPVEGVNLQTLWYQRAQRVHGHLPMHKQQLAPRLIHDRRATGPLAQGQPLSRIWH